MFHPPLCRWNISHDHGHDHRHDHGQADTTGQHQDDASGLRSRLVVQVAYRSRTPRAVCGVGVPSGNSMSS